MENHSYLDLVETDISDVTLKLERRTLDKRYILFVDPSVTIFDLDRDFGAHKFELDVRFLCLVRSRR